MATIVTRAGKGSPLTHNEVDANFTNLNSDKIESGDTVASLTLTAVDVADKITHTGDTNTSIRFPAADTVTVETAGSERVRVSSSGDVGIGTSSPARIFQVSGTGSELMRLERTGSTAGVGIEFKNDSGDFAMFGNASGAGTGAFIPQGDGGVDLGSSGNRFKDFYLSGGVSNPTAGGTLTFSVTGSERMRIDSSGNVGIGTSSPSVPLHISNSNPTIRYQDNDGTNQYGEVQMAGGNFIIQSRNDASNGGILFRGLGGGAATEHMRIDSGGNVGIGTSSPSEKLDVSGNVTISGSLSKGSGSFKIDHPIKPDTHHLVHSFIEGPQADNIYRGKVTLVDGTATVNLDEAGRMSEGTFVALNGNVQCFTTNEDGWTAVRGKVDGNILTIEAQDATCTDIVSWLVIGERHDQHMIDANWTDEQGRIITEPEKETKQ